MKELLIHVSPKKEFCDEEHKMAVRIQIDNSLSLGQKPEDIVLATNFDYEYRSVKSVLIGDDNLADHFVPATKIYAITSLLNSGLIGKDIYWYHDFDCFQLNPMTDIEKDMAGYDMGVTNYGRMPRMCSASIFFRDTAKDIFNHLKGEIAKNKSGEEGEITKLMENKTAFTDRIKHLNITYAFHKFNLKHCYDMADKPIKAVHFHLTPDKYDFYVRGNNKMGMVLIPERLIEIFHKHGFDGSGGDDKRWRN
jgi:hypothetical protein